MNSNIDIINSLVLSVFILIIKLFLHSNAIELVSLIPSAKNAAFKRSTSLSILSRFLALLTQLILKTHS
jgi:preprotein translocase subunit SecG